MAWTTKADNFATTQVNDPGKLQHPATKLISFDEKRVQVQFQMNLAAFTKACCDRTLHVLLSKINFRFYAKPNSIFIGYYGFQKCDQAHIIWGCSVI